MKVVLKKKPKGVRIIEGFPGFGLIGTIATEFLLDHLKTEKIGTVEIDEIPAMIAIHQNKVIEPISFHYNKKYNLLIVHAINIGKDLGWKLADVINIVAKQLQAKEIISLEGVGGPNSSQSRVFYFTEKKTPALRKLEGHANPLMEGIIVGVTGALLSKETQAPLLALFAEAKSNMPDSRAAAQIIEALDAYLGLDVNPDPLLDQAKLFEKKLQGIATKKVAVDKIHQKKNRLSYVG